ncbi:hypothetical protein DL95DRAFT_390871 [Leptodontidium sp. 2 PMI_412]|nr:hypothetical protein DL95DRAFT_390871 [Leptodontidium sp. 2 PMI_412]
MADRCETSAYLEVVGGILWAALHDFQGLHFSPSLLVWSFHSFSFFLARVLSFFLFFSF